MTFDEKVKFLRTLPLFKVIPISEVRAVAFAATEKEGLSDGDLQLTKSGSSLLVLSLKDVEKIVREYPDLEAKLTSK